jgi:D-alanine-D-alanine ligase
MKSKRIGILMGGLSAEREVSLKTGEAIYKALKEQGYNNLVKIIVDRDIDQRLRATPIDVAFLALHGSFGEDGCIQGLLEILGIPYTGPGVTESALAMDKLKSKELFRLFNVPTPPYYVIQADEISDIERIHGSFGFSVFVKPRKQGSSVGAGRADTMTELQSRCHDAAKYGDSVLIERYIQGREVTVGVLDGKALGALEIVPKSQTFYDYEAKYHSTETTYIYPAPLPPARYKRVLDLGERAVQALGTPGIVRVDLLVTEGENEYVLEVNTLPGMTASSLIPKIAKGAGYSYGELCELILSRATLYVDRCSATNSNESKQSCSCCSKKVVQFAASC